MEIIPVLDLMNGEVVRGVAGRRESYRPIESILTSSTHPLRVAEAIQDQLGLSRFYIADLDAIRFGKPQYELLQALGEAFPGCWLDGGIRTPKELEGFQQTHQLNLVAGLETVEGPNTLRELCDCVGTERVVFSLDLKHGTPLGDLKNWKASSAFAIAGEAAELGIEQLIVLDLAHVGMPNGVSTIPLCQQIQRVFPNVRITTGGGIRHLDDLIALKQCQIDGVLVASAFHAGHITRQHLDRLVDAAPQLGGT